MQTFRFVQLKIANEFNPKSAMTKIGTIFFVVAKVGFDVYFFVAVAKE